ncbi:MAG: MATE family efflux transporter [Lachnospira sp.]
MSKPLSADRRNMILSGNLIQAILMLAIPVMINSFIQSMYNLTDTFWLGRIGTESQAAITLVSPIQNILINFGTGLTTAGAILISQYLGAKEDRQANSMANHVCLCSLLFSLVCAAVCWCITPGIVGWLGAEGNIFLYGISYLRIVVLDLPFLFMINIYTAVKQSQGDTVRPMLLNVLGVSINLILDPLFLMKFGWGISGAALATLLAKIPSAVLALYVLTRKGQLIQINFKGFRFEKTKMLSILKIGLPTAIGGSTMQFGFLLMTKNVNAYGTTATTAYGIGNKINSIITMPANGIGSAISTIVGQNFGAGNIKRTDKSYHIALRIGAVFLFVCGMILSRRFIAEPIVRFFTSDDAVVPLATDFLSIMAICCWTNAFYNVTQGLFQGCGHTMITMMVDASRIWVFRFLTLWVCATLLHMGVESIWYAVVVSNATSALILYILYWTGIWKHRTVKIEKKCRAGPVYNLISQFPLFRYIPVSASPLSAGGDSFCTYISQNRPVPQIQNAGGSPIGAYLLHHSE